VSNLVERSFSAGGVIIGPNKKVVLVSQSGRKWSLPKGRIEKGEDHKAAALREIEEETGLSKIEFIDELGTYERFKMTLTREDDKSTVKNITLFLFKTDQSELRPIDPENEHAIWLEVDKAAEKLTHPKDREFYLGVLPKVKAFIKTLE
jgi:ADP-ribose pyrophosphatase YjhB (NUDIX family)